MALADDLISSLTASRDDLTAKLDSIIVELKTAHITALATGEATDPAWFHRALTAKRHTFRDLRDVQSRLADAYAQKKRENIEADARRKSEAAEARAKKDAARDAYEQRVATEFKRLVRERIGGEEYVRLWTLAHENLSAVASDASAPRKTERV